MMLAMDGVFLSLIYKENFEFLRLNCASKPYQTEHVRTVLQRKRAWCPARRTSASMPFHEDMIYVNIFEDLETVQGQDRLSRSYEYSKVS
jgi:hypothetical protein